jgi:DNA-binding HxlR family transcriptional regulator
MFVLTFDSTRGVQGLTQGKVGSAVDTFREQAVRCPFPAAVELIGEKWAFLILRGAFNELHHFEEFQAGLGIARNILSDRLAKMVAGGILKRDPDPSDRRKVIYSLTTKGEALMPVVLALRQWGEDWGSGPADIVLVDRSTGIPVRKICVLSEDGRRLKHDDMVWAKRIDAGAASKGQAA